ncbi:MAG: COG1470 family protein, partial [Planctomycetota bacterium]
PSTFISGVFPIQIKATALGVTKIANASLYLRPKGDYAIQISQKTIALNTRGESRSITLTITPLEGFRSQIGFTVTELPSGVRANINPSNVTIQSDAPVTVILTLISEQYADPGTYNVAVISSTGVTSRTVNLNLLLRTGAGEIWPVVVLIGVVIGIASVIAFIGVPRGKHTHLIRD